MPPRNPPRNHLADGKEVRGKRYWKRQILPQLEPMAPVRKAAVRRMRLARRLSSEVGEEKNLRYLGSEKRV